MQPNYFLPNLDVCSFSNIFFYNNTSSLVLHTDFVAQDVTCLLIYIFTISYWIFHLCPQTWHVPSRIDGIEPRPVLYVTVQKVQPPSSQKRNQKKRKSFWSSKYSIQAISSATEYTRYAKDVETSVWKPYSQAWLSEDLARWWRRCWIDRK